MLAKERQEYIHRQIRNKGAVTTAELIEQLGVSIETVRRDLLTLEQHRLLQRVHGGAVTMGGMKPFRALSHRIQENEKAKQELSATAAKRVRDGDIVGIDAGSTSILFAEALKKELCSLTVVTYSLDVFESLCQKLSCDLMRWIFSTRGKHFLWRACAGFIEKAAPAKGLSISLGSFFAAWHRRLPKRGLLSAKAAVAQRR